MIQFALLGWQAVVLLLFKRLNPAAAVATAIIGGYLLLPTRGGWDWPIIPVLDKDSLTALTGLLAAYAVTSTTRKLPEQQTRIRPGWLPRSRTGLGLSTLLVLGSIMTAQQNGTPLVYELRVLRGLSIYDGISDALRISLSLIPLLLARKFLAYPEGQKTLLTALAISGLLYSLPALYEVHMSPQLNRMVYDFFPHQWRQHIRSGGFRPIVFLQHGLWLGIFLSMATIAAAALGVVTGSRRRFYLWTLLWLAMTLLLSKNFGALSIALLLVPVVLLMPIRIQLMAAVMISTFVLAYPTLRGAGLVPTATILSMVDKVRPDRTASLHYRFTNEQILLDKANQKPLFGWGSSGRNRAYDEKGRDIATTDGGWVLAIGSGGWVRYFSQMGLMALPILLLASNRRRYEIDAVTAGLCLVLSANMLDLVPNSTLTPVTWLVTGALLGRLELGRISQQVPTEGPSASRIPYTRQIRPLMRKE